MRQTEDLWIIIPARNEARRVGDVISKCKKYSKNIILLDDGSDDNTGEVGKKLGVCVLRHILNLGKGAALKTGSDYAYLHGAKYFIVLDADGQHNPEEIPNFIKQLKENDVVFGSRGLNANMPFVFRLGNWGINKLTKMLYSVELKDTQSGFRAFTREAYKKIRWNATNYAVESEIIANVGKHLLKYTEINIETIYLDKYKGTTVLDGLRIGLNMLMWRLK